MRINRAKTTTVLRRRRFNVRVTGRHTDTYIHLASVAVQAFSVTRCLRCCSSHYATCMWDVFVYLVGGRVGWWVGVAGDCVVGRVVGVVAGPMLPGHGRNRVEQPGWECSPVCVCTCGLAEFAERVNCCRMPEQRCQQECVGNALGHQRTKSPPKSRILDFGVTTDQ